MGRVVKLFGEPTGLFCGPYQTNWGPHRTIRGSCQTIWGPYTVQSVGYRTSPLGRVAQMKIRKKIIDAIFNKKMGVNFLFGKNAKPRGVWQKTILFPDFHLCNLP